MTATEVERSRSRCVDDVAYRLHEDKPPHRGDCPLNIGLMRTIGPIFGLPPLDVVHTECQVLGAPECRYTVTWSSRRFHRRFDRRFDRRRSQLRALDDQVDALTAQIALLQSTTEDLVSSDDVDAVLARIVTRAGRAVSATGYLLGAYARSAAVALDAAVLLWDPETETLRMAGRSGWAPGVRELVDGFEISAAASPGLQDYLHAPAPTIMRLDRPDPGPVARCLQPLQVPALAVAPLRAHPGGLFGLAIASISPTDESRRNAIVERLTAIADHAATIAKRLRAVLSRPIVLGEYRRRVGSGSRRCAHQRQRSTSSTTTLSMTSPTSAASATSMPSVT